MAPARSWSYARARRELGSTARQMREAELWSRLEKAVGASYARAWADLVVMSDLGGRTVVEAIAAGLPCKRIWRAVWAQLELPPAER